MMSYHQQVKDKILEINFYLVKEIKLLDEIIIVEYSTSNLYLLTDILRIGDYDSIASLEPIQNLFGEYIYVYRFSDELDRIYYAMVYDPTGLYQRLTILEMFREVKSR